MPRVVSGDCFCMNRSYVLITEVLFIFYSAALLFLILYGIIQIHLVYQYLRFRKRPKDDCPPLTHFPFVTVQLPVYNESLVIERLINAVAQLDYPKNSFEVQVLDDSTD